MNNKQAIREYFRNISSRLLSDAKSAQNHHPTLTGQHREQVLRLYLNDILPRKYSVGNGVIYGTGIQDGFKSNEADIIIWDSFEYPQIKLYGYSLYFAESTKLVIEVKSDWSEREFADIRGKTEVLKRYVIHAEPSVKDEIWKLNNQLAAMAAGKEFPTMMLETPKIGVASICFWGGNQLTKAHIIKDQVNTEGIEDNWPDVMLFLDIGKVVYKQYIVSDGAVINGVLQITDAGSDALLFFTELIFNLLKQRGADIDSPFTFMGFLEDVMPHFKNEEIEFPVRKLTIPGVITVIGSK